VDQGLKNSIRKREGDNMVNANLKPLHIAENTYYIPTDIRLQVTYHSHNYYNRIALFIVHIMIG
jgi:hypothetical protein